LFMAVHLSSDTLARLGEAQTTLLSPLAERDTEAWGRAVNEALCALFRAETAVAVLPSRAVVARNFDERGFEVIEHFLVEPMQTGGAAPDPGVMEVGRRRRARGLGVMTWPIIDRLLGGQLLASPYYHESVRALCAQHHHGMFLPQGLEPGAYAQVEVYHTHGARNPFGVDGADVMALLVPAYRAGVAALTRLGRQRAALDALGTPVAVIDVDGRTAHRNEAFERALAADPQRLRVAAAVEAFARDLATPEGGFRPERRVRTAAGTYGLSGTLMPEGSPFGPGPCVIVSLDPPASPWPAPDALRQRFGMTRREAEVALLLARGLANNDAADALCISPHTVRRHTERVMAKLAVEARGQVAAAILAPETASGGGSHLS